MKPKIISLRQWTFWAFKFRTTCDGACTNLSLISDGYDVHTPARALWGIHKRCSNLGGRGFLDFGHQ